MPKRFEATDGKWILLLALLSGLAFAAEGALRMLMQLYLKEAGAVPLVISLNTSVAWLGLSVGTSVWGYLSDRFSRKPMLLIILLAGALTSGLLALFLPPAAALVMVGVRASLISGLIPIAMGLVSGEGSAKGRGRRVSYMGASRALGLALGFVLGGGLLEAIGLRASFLTLAALPLLSTMLLVPFPRSDEHAVVSGRTAGWRCLGPRGLRGLYLGVLLRQTAIVGCLSLIYVYMDDLGVRAGIMGIVTSLGPGMAVLGMLLSGRATDRIGRKRVFVFGFALSLLVPALFAVSGGAAGIAAGYVALGLSFGSLYIGSTAHIGDVMPASRHGEMIGLFEASRGIGGVLGPLVAGSVVAFVGYRGMFLVLLGIAALGLLLASFRTQEAADGPADPC